MIPRIMIVDDEENFATTLAERLKMRDYDVHTCFSGDQAIEAIRQRHIDVVILDVAMPGKNGIETLGEIKKIKPLTEVLMLTGQATVETAIEGMKLGAHDYLMKPCDTEELVKKINESFERKKAQEEKITEAKMKELISSPHAVFRKK